MHHTRVYAPDVDETKEGTLLSPAQSMSGAPRYKTWTCVLVNWTDEQREQLRTRGRDGTYTKHGALRTNGPALEGFFSFNAPKSAKNLMDELSSDAQWRPSRFGVWIWTGFTSAPNCELLIEDNQIRGLSGQGVSAGLQDPAHAPAAPSCIAPITAATLDAAAPDSATADSPPSKLMPRLPIEDSNTVRGLSGQDASAGLQDPSTPVTPSCTAAITTAAPDAATNDTPPPQVNGHAPAQNFYLTPAPH